MMTSSERECSMKISMLKIPYRQLVPYELSSTSILLYGILLFYAYERDCITTNKTLAEQLQITERSVQNCLKELKDKNVINITFEKLQNNVEVRHITPLVLFDLVIAPNNKKSETTDIYAGFEVA